MVRSGFWRSNGTLVLFLFLLGLFWGRMWRPRASNHFAENGALGQGVGEGSVDFNAKLSEN